MIRPLSPVHLTTASCLLLVLVSESYGETIRVATLNASMYGTRTGELLNELTGGESERATAAACILQTVRPDIVLINEIDYSENNACAVAFRDRYLAKSHGDLSPLKFQHLFSAPVNTGVPSGMDLDRDGKDVGPGDCWGFGDYPGQYGMAVYSRFPIDGNRVRTFQRFRWALMPGALQPVDPETKRPFYRPEVFDRLRLSSKSHWDLPIITGKRTLHVLVSHPTPPVFDGPEDRNVCRTHDEIRFWTEYLRAGTGAVFIDDQGRRGSLPSTARFILLGDFNADAIDGSGRREAIASLLAHPRVHDPRPQSRGATQSASKAGGLNLKHQSDSSTDTAEFNAAAVGNLRVDYVLPSRNLDVSASGVFWPTSDDPSSKWIHASDHRLVWVDIEVN